jgi:hypothetical protein
MHIQTAGFWRLLIVSRDLWTQILSSCILTVLLELKLNPYQALRLVVFSVYRLSDSATAIRCSLPCVGIVGLDDVKSRTPKCWREAIHLTEGLPRVGMLRPYLSIDRIHSKQILALFF